jgi:hypothetical protein
MVDSLLSRLGVILFWLWAISTCLACWQFTPASGQRRGRVYVVSIVVSLITLFGWLVALRYT